MFHGQLSSIEANHENVETAACCTRTVLRGRTVCLVLYFPQGGRNIASSLESAHMVDAAHCMVVVNALKTERPGKSRKSRCAACSVTPCLVAMQTDPRRCNEYGIRPTCRECESCEWKGIACKLMTIRRIAKSAHGVWHIAVHSNLSHGRIVIGPLHAA